MTSIHDLNSGGITIISNDITTYERSKIDSFSSTQGLNQLIPQPTDLLPDRFFLQI